MLTTVYTCASDSVSVCVGVFIIHQWGMSDPRADNERLAEVAFSSDRKRMEVSHSPHHIKRLPHDADVRTRMLFCRRLSVLSTGMCCYLPYLVPGACSHFVTPWARNSFLKYIALNR